MTGAWLREERAGTAAAHLLDAAGRVFAERGVGETEMRHIAEAAGCSRATLYRYFENRQALLTAYMHRRTHRVLAEVAARIESADSASERLVEAVLGALAAVRGDPHLAAWFTAADSARTAELAGSSELLATLCAAFLGDPAEADVRFRARWLLRVTLSLLATPGRDAAEERALLTRFAAPVLLPGPE